MSTEWWSGKIVTVGKVCEYRMVEWEDCDCGKCVSTEWWSGKIVTVGSVRVQSGGVGRL